MKILIAASEFFPFFKTGGLADVTGAMARIFSQVKNNKVVVFVPKYKMSSGCLPPVKAIAGSFTVNVGGVEKKTKLFKTRCGRAEVYFVENEHYFNRSNLYGAKNADYSDNDRRFIFFCRAVIEGARFLGFKPDIIHCHDWQTGLVPAYLKNLYAEDTFFKKTKTVFTIHNLAYQGFFSKKAFDASGFPERYFNQDELEYYGGINFLKNGIAYSDIVTTVSPNYGKEALSSPKISYRLNGVLASRGKNFYGILNGVDNKVWNPKTDALIAKKYNAASFKKGKAACKKNLQNKYNLTQNPDIALVGIVSRLDYQKGLDIVAKTIPQFSGRVQFAVLGTGDKKLEDEFKTLAREFKGSLFFVNKLDEVLAHNIYSASDIFLMPSRFEPCGLSQMIALKYGGVVVANKTGGLADTVLGYGESKKPNGFFMNTFGEESLADALSAAFFAFGDKPLWYNMVANAMKADFSWDKSAGKYLKIFDKLIGRRHLKKGRLKNEVRRK